MAERLIIKSNSVVVDWYNKDEIVYNKRNGGKLVGEIKFLDKGKNILIEVNDGRLIRAKIQFARIGIFRFGPMITLDTPTYESILPSNKFSDYFVIFHEVGHYMCNHCKEEGENDGDVYIQKRIECLLRGEVWYEELEADRYASEVLGREAAKEGLKQAMMSSIKQDMEDGVFGDAASQLTINEYKNRIKALP